MCIFTSVKGHLLVFRQLPVAGCRPFFSRHGKSRLFFEIHEKGAVSPFLFPLRRDKPLEEVTDGYFRQVQQFPGIEEGPTA